MTGSEDRYEKDDIVAFVATALRHYGMPRSEAQLGAEILVDADLSGVDTHGVANLAGHAHYLPGLRSGYVAAKAEPVTRRESPVSAAWDSGQGFGPVVAHRAMQTAMDKAKATGIGMVTVRAGRHFGANGYFAEMAAAQDMVGMVSANTPVAGVPPGARRAVVGPNPFGFGAPVGDGRNLVLDVSMTAASGSKVIIASRLAKQVPLGWVVDAEGRQTTDPKARAAGGGLELLGGPVAGHKGLGLALMVDTLGILAGNGSGLWQGGAGSSWTQGQWFACWRIDLFVDPAEFHAEMQRLAEDLSGVPTDDGAGVRLPGHRRAACREERSRSGVPLAAYVVSDLRRVAADIGHPFPSPVEE